MVTGKLRSDEAQIDELGSDPGQIGSDSAGQSGDPQGLSQIADADEESVGELAETDQAYEAGDRGRSRGRCRPPRKGRTHAREQGPVATLRLSGNRSFVP